MCAWLCFNCILTFVSYFPQKRLPREAILVLFTSWTQKYQPDMAEGLAVVGVVTNIIQLVEFGSKVLLRLNEFQSSLGDIPETFRHVKAELQYY